MSPWKYNLIYEGFRAFTYAFVTLGFSYRSEGKNNVPHNGPLLIVSNHQSWFDPFLIGLAIPRRIRFMARRTLFTGSRGMNAFLSGLSVIPVNQEGFAREGLRLTRERLDAGEAVLIFPEGQRTWDGNIGKLMPGVTLLIRQTGADVLPVGIAGAWHAWPRWKLLPFMSPLFLPANEATIAVSIGKPIRGKQLAEMERHAMLSTMWEQMHQVWASAKRLRRRG
jgi:1-acyl-sn-glycerol-3-phosphate acyltransferase